MSLNYPFDKLLTLEKLTRQYPTSNLDYLMSIQRKFAYPEIRTPLEALTRNLAFVPKGHTPVVDLIRQSVMSKMMEPTMLTIAQKFNTPLSGLTAIEYAFEDEETDEDQIIEVVDHTKAIIQGIYKDNNLLDILEGRQFEEVVAELLASKGFEVELTKQTRDGGYDILALNMIEGFPVKFLVECKRKKAKVGIEIIRSFCDVIREENANKGIIVTTSYFTSGVTDNQKERRGHLLDLRNRDDVINWVTDYQFGK